MRPTFLGFEAARKSIAASQLALDITGQNISNVNTKGYTRQRVDLFSVSNSSEGSRLALGNWGLAGQGVHTGGVDQIRDQFLDKKFREINPVTAEAGVRSGILSDVEKIINNADPDVLGIFDVMANFKSCLSDFAADAADKSEIGSVARQSAMQIVSMLGSYDERLSEVAEQTLFEVENYTKDINATLQKIASYNSQIKDAYVSSGEVSTNYAADYTVNVRYGPNELLDARNVLLDELSTYADIEVVSEPDGTVSVYMSTNPQTANGNDKTLVIGDDKFATLSIDIDKGTGAIVASFDTGAEFMPNSGRLKGYIDIYNGNGPYAYAPQNHQLGIPYFRSTINEFANKIANEFNSINVVEQQIYNEDGTVNLEIAPFVNITGGTISLSDPNNQNIRLGKDADGNDVLLTRRDLFVASDNSFDFTATNIRVSQEWINDPSYIVINQDGTLDNQSIMKLLSVFDRDITFGKNDEFTGTIEEFINYYSTSLGQEIDFQNGKYDSSFAITETVLGDRDSVSAVNLDEEGVYMLNYQKWFNASSRLMTTLDEALNTIINSMGLVGR